MTSGCPFHQAMAPEHRADPYPFYADLAGEIARLDDGRYVVSRYDDVLALLHDPRLSSAGHEDGAAAPDPTERLGMSLLRLDPPEHDRLRRIVMRQFGPPNRPRMVHDLEDEIVRVVDALLDDMATMGGEAEVVGAFAHRLPIAIICKLFGIPVAFEDRFRSFVDVIVSGTGQRQLPPEVGEAMKKLGGLLFETAKQRRGGDGDDLLSGLVNDDGPEGRLPEQNIAAMAVLLLIAGHETTVNLIANGILTLLRHPEEAARLRRDPERAIGLVEELLRFEPPVQFIQNRITLSPVEVGGITVPTGARVVLLLAAANRDPARFEDPHRFDPGRSDNQHLGFGSGIHTCFGAALARLEGQIALQLFFDRVANPSLARAPDYRVSPLLRGPRELVVRFDAIRPKLREVAA